MSSRQEDFQRAFRNLQLQPLITPEDRQKFRVPYGEELLPELEQIIVDCTDNNNQLIFAGHRGCGKSTLLAEFAQQIKDCYFTVFFSISDLIEMSEINHINILFAIALQLMAEATEQELRIAEDKQQSIFDWFKKRTRTETTGGSGELEFGFNLFSIIKVKLKSDAAVRDEIKTEFDKNFRDLMDAKYLNKINYLFPVFKPCGQGA